MAETLTCSAAIAAGAADAMGYVLRCAIFGRSLILIGAIQRAAELVGVAVARHVMLGLTPAGALAGLVGAVQIAPSRAASSQIGPGFTLPALAVFLGASTIQPERFNVGGTELRLGFP